MRMRQRRRIPAHAATRRRKRTPDGARFACWLGVAIEILAFCWTVERAFEDGSIVEPLLFIVFGAGIVAVAEAVCYRKARKLARVAMRETRGKRDET